MQCFLRPAVTLAAALACLATMACHQKTNQYAPPPPPDVTVARPLRQGVTDYLYFTGTIAALQYVELHPRVQGYVEKIHFQANQWVEEGQLLVTIDPRPYKAKVDKAKADLVAREANAKGAEDKVRRAKASGDAASKQELVTLQTDLAKALADIGLSKAELQSTELDLGFTEVRAPFAGRISRNLVDPGTLVGTSADSSALATIANDKQVYAYFTTSERDMLAYIRQHPEARQPRSASDAKLPVFLSVADEADYPHEGWFDAADNQLDQGTGTLRLRAVFPNPDRLLSQNMFVRLRVANDSREATLVPTVAIGSDQFGKYVLVVGPDHKVERRPVEVGPVVGRMRRIDKGLGPDDWVVVVGTQQARPGSTVKPEETNLTAEPAKK